MTVSGVWHGAGFSFVAWGLLHGLYQIFDDIIKPLRKHIPQFFQLIVTFAEVSFAWIFFRADSFLNALGIIRIIFTRFDILALFGDCQKLYSLDAANIRLLLRCTLLLFAVDFANYKGQSVKDWLLGREWYLQMAAFVAGVLFVAVCGIYGPAYDAAGFIYFQF
ncbi:MAG: hypothetical protein J1D88_09320 [Treponema sp.]|nr:hypothetical protein [Treponema sp.]